MNRLKGIVLSMGLLFLSGCAGTMGVKMKQDVSANVTEKVESKYTGPKRRVGVIDFENKTAYGQTRLGQAASDILITELVKTGKFIVVEREKVNKLLEEQKLGLTGAIDPNTAAQMGKVLGLNAIVTGAISNFGVRTTGSDYLITQTKRQEATCTIDVRVVDAETGQILFADSGKGVSKVGSGSFLGLGTRGGDADGSTVYLDAGMDSGLEVGQKLAAYKLGREIKSPQTGLVIGRTEEKLGELVIDSFFGENGSKAIVKTGRSPGPGDLCRMAQ